MRNRNLKHPLKRRVRWFSDCFFLASSSMERSAHRFTHSALHNTRQAAVIIRASRCRATEVILLWWLPLASRSSTRWTSLQLHCVFPVALQSLGFNANYNVSVKRSHNSENDRFVCRLRSRLKIPYWKHFFWQFRRLEVLNFVKRLPTIVDIVFSVWPCLKFRDENRQTGKVNHQIVVARWTTAMRPTIEN